MSKYSNNQGRATEGQALLEMLIHPALHNPTIISSSESERAIQLYSDMKKLLGFHNINIKNNLDAIFKIEKFEKNPTIKLLPDNYGSKGFSEDIIVEDGIKSISFSVKNKRMDTKSLRFGKKDPIDKYAKITSTAEEIEEYLKIKKFIKENNGTAWGSSDNQIKIMIFKLILSYLQRKIQRLSVNEIQQLILGFLGRNDYYQIGLDKIYVYNPNGTLNFGKTQKIQQLVSSKLSWDTLKLFFDNDFGVYIRLHNDTSIIGKTNPKLEIGHFIS